MSDPVMPVIIQLPPEIDITNAGDVLEPITAACAPGVPAIIPVRPAALISYSPAATRPAQPPACQPHEPRGRAAGRLVLVATTGPAQEALLRRGFALE